jgi:hypothetical protein
MEWGLLNWGTPAIRTTERNRLAGTITVDGQPASRLVVVLERKTFVLVAATFSNPTTGAWEIKGIAEYPMQSLLVMSLDNGGDYNAEVADYISQVAPE